MPKFNTKFETLKADETVAATDGEVIPSSIDAVESHLHAFVAAFVLPHVQPRWLEFLIDRRSQSEASLESRRRVHLLFANRPTIKDRI